MSKIFGSMTALITPFKNNKVDFNTYEALIKRQIKLGIDAIVPVGTTGESATLSYSEHEECIKIAIDICKGTNVKVVAGAGSNDTNRAIDLAIFASKLGADAILSVVPYYNKPTQNGLYLHYKAISDAIDLPIFLYNVPSRCGTNLESSTIIKLFNDTKNIIGIKEASGDIEKCVDLLSKEPDLTILSGEDAINYPILSQGGKGVVSVSANLMPDKISSLVNRCLNKDFEGSKSINDELFKLNKILFCESNPIPIKAAMFIAGLVPNLEYRLPLCPPSKENLIKIENVLKQYDIKGF